VVVGFGPGIRVVGIEGPKAVSEVLTIWLDALNARANRAEKSKSLRSIGDAIEARKIHPICQV